MEIPPKNENQNINEEVVKPELHKKSVEHTELGLGNKIPSPQDLQREFQEVIQKKFGGQVQVISLDTNQTPPQPEVKETFDPSKILNFSLKPKDIKEHLDKYVIGQDEVKKALAIAVCDHYNHLKAEISGDIFPNYQKQNVLVVGPTGVGKTFLVKLIADLIGVPFVKADATRFSEVGYMGANVDDVIRDLVQQAKGNLKLAEMGIVYLDEVDKIASTQYRRQKDVNGRGVQFGFLRLLEDSEVDLNGNHDIASQFKTLMSFQKKGKADKEIVRTKNILFIFSGAFNGLDEIIKKRLKFGEIGLTTGIEKLDLSEQAWLEKVRAEDFVEFGFEQEFVGRLPVQTVCHNLTAEHLYEILKNSKTSILKQYERAFALYAVKISFTEGALKKLAQLAFEQKTGARALVNVFENLLRNYKYELASGGSHELIIDEQKVPSYFG